MLRVSLAPCSPFSVTGDLMRESTFCRERFGETPLDHVESLGWIGPDVWFAHGVHVNDAEAAHRGLIERRERLLHQLLDATDALCEVVVT